MTTSYQKKEFFTLHFFSVRLKAKLWSLLFKINEVKSKIVSV